MFAQITVAVNGVIHVFSQEENFGKWQSAEPL
jgi:hypothetical protein